MVLDLINVMFVHILFAINIAIELPITVIVYAFTGKKIGILNGENLAIMRFTDWFLNYLDRLINGNH